MDQEELTLDAPALGGSAEAVVEREAENPGWRATLYTIWVAQIFAMVGFAFVMPFIPFFIPQLGVTNPRLVPIWSGLIVTGSGVMMSVMAPIWGSLADRYGRKAMVQRAMFGGAVVLGSMAFVTNVHQLLFLRTLQGGITGTMSASVALVSSVVPRAYMGFSLGLIQTAVFTGDSFGPLLGGLAAERFGFRIPFLITGGLLIVGGCLVLFGAKERFKRPSPEEHRAAGSILDLLRNPGMVILLVVYTLINLGGSLAGPIFPLFVKELAGNASAGRAASLTGIIIAVAGVTSAVASVVVGRCSDRWGHRPMLVACVGAAGVMCLPQAIVRSVPQLLIVRAIFGMGAGGMTPAMNAIISSMAPRNRLGQAYGITTAAASIGWATGPAIGGWVASILGLRVPFVMTGLILIGMAAVAQKWLRESR
ncbi:MAG: MFS transporter [Armatimonadota bacterium]|jgi:DHA1 family multidrug resistance protein-like MFS transporter